MPDAPFGRALVGALVMAACAVAAFTFGVAHVDAARGASADAAVLVAIGVIAGLVFVFVSGNRVLEARGVFEQAPPLGEGPRRGLIALAAVAATAVLAEIAFAVTGNRVLEIGLGLVLSASIALVTTPGVVAAVLAQQNATSDRVVGAMFALVGISQGVLAFQRIAESLPHDDWFIAVMLCFAPVATIYGVCLARGVARSSR